MRRPLAAPGAPMDGVSFRHCVPGRRKEFRLRRSATGSLFAPSWFAALPGGQYALLDPNSSEVAIF